MFVKAKYNPNWELQIDFEVVDKKVYCVIKEIENGVILNCVARNAKAHETDQFNKIKGRNIALLRVMNAFGFDREERLNIIEQLRSKYNFRMNPGKRRKK
jgi:hypothetical protein